MKKILFLCLFFFAVCSFSTKSYGQMFSVGTCASCTLTVTVWLDPGCCTPCSACGPIVYTVPPAVTCVTNYNFSTGCACPVDHCTISDGVNPPISVVVNNNPPATGTLCGTAMTNIRLAGASLIVQ